MSIAEALKELKALAAEAAGNARRDPARWQGAADAFGVALQIIEPAVKCLLQELDQRGYWACYNRDRAPYFSGEWARLNERYKTLEEAERLAKHGIKEAAR